MISYDAIKSGEVAVPVKATVAKEIGALPAMVKAAADKLASATTSAEVLDAKDAAALVYDASKRAARMAKAKKAHDELIAAAHRAQADALDIEAAAKRRLADEYDGGQERGEIAGPGNPAIVLDGNNRAKVEETGLTRKQVHDARRVRNAEKAKPGVVKEALDQAIAEGKEPTRAVVNAAVGEALGEEKPAPAPRNIVAEVCELWNMATPSEREEIRAFINSPAPEQKTAGHAPRDMGSDGANAGGNDVDGSAKRAGHAGQPFDALSGQVETRNSDNFVERTTSGPDAKRAQFSPPDGDAFSEVKGTARPENAAGVEPSPSVAVADPQAPRPSATAEISDLPVSSSRQVGRAEAPSSSPGASAALHCPANPAVADGQPSTPTPDALAAGQGSMPGSIAKSGDAVTSPKPGCLSPDNCRIKFQTSALCWKCRDAQIKARAA